MDGHGTPPIPLPAASLASISPAARSSTALSNVTFARREIA